MVFLFYSFLEMEVDTKNILFICGGAFPELEEIIKERLNKEAPAKEEAPQPAE